MWSFVQNFRERFYEKNVEIGHNKVNDGEKMNWSENWNLMMDLPS